MRSTKTEIPEDLRSHWLPGLDPLIAMRNDQSQNREGVTFRGSRAQPLRRSNVSFDVELSIDLDPPEWPAFGGEVLLQDQPLNQRLERNLQAIACMKALKGQSRVPTLQERQRMLGYAGWSGAARMFEPLAANSLVQYRQSLSAMVSATDFAGARANVARAVFPSLLTVNTIWRLICQLGFKGGRVVDPAAGAGHLVSGMPPEIARKSEIAVVEQDPIASELLDLTFSDLGVRVQCSPIENAVIFNGYYDLALTTVPCSGPKPQERANVAYANWDTSNYLIGKAIDLVRPGGLVVLLAPSDCMDSQQQRHRDWINAHAELLTAIRLPGEIAVSAGNQRKAMDILVFKRRRMPAYPALSSWSGIAQAPKALMRAGQALEHYVGVGRKRTWVERPRLINQWYVQNPHAVMGELSIETDVYGRSTTSICYRGDNNSLRSRLDGLIESLGGHQYQNIENGPAHRLSRMLMPVDATCLVTSGAYVVHKGRICVGKDETHWLDVDDAYAGKTRERLLSLIELRTVVLKHAESMSREPAGLQTQLLKAEADKHYAAFVARFGRVNALANTRVFRSDPYWTLLCDRESYGEEATLCHKAVALHALSELEAVSEE